MPTYPLTLITGGSSGIGFALAKALLTEGGDVCLLARDTKKLQIAKQNLTDLKVHPEQRIEILSADVANFQTLASLLTEWTADFGIPDLVINSAGVTYPGYFQDLDVDIFHWLMDVNYFGTLHILKCLIPGMIERGSGTVVNISSQAGLIGVFGYSGYGASKYAVQGLSDVLRAEMKPLGIKVALVAPPDTQTPQLEFEKDLKPPETKAIASSASVLTADEVASAILKGLRKDKYLIIPGFEGKLFFRLTQVIGSLTYPIMDILVRRAQKTK